MAAGREVKGSTTGVQHPVAEDMALMGDTRNALHTRSLPKQELPYKAHQNPHSFGSGGTGDEKRDDSGHGQTCDSDGMC